MPARWSQEWPARRPSAAGLGTLLVVQARVTVFGTQWVG
jgi:hypothetical protein